MKAGIINIGDELLIGQTVNTNATWLGKNLGEAGITVFKSATIEDDRDAIVQTLDDYIQTCELVIITGGLGPTKDDITKTTLAKYFNTDLELNKEVLKHIQSMLNQKGIEMLESNVLQAHLPKNATILKNSKGTASGMVFEKDGKPIISLPGVPYEMQAIITEEALPLLKKRFELQGKYYQTVMVQGIGESTLAEKIKDWECQIENEGLHLAYLPSPGLIKLRLNSDRGDKDKLLIEERFNQLSSKFQKYIYSNNEESIFETVGALLKAKHLTLGTVESCTGGKLSSSFVKFPGASDFFKGSLITYSNGLKIKLAKVTAKTIDEFGAVSENTAKEMALGGKSILNTDYTIAITGIAGPDGGTKEKSVGTVCIAVATPNEVFSHVFSFGDDRNRTITKSCLYATNFLRQILLNIDTF